MRTCEQAADPYVKLMLAVIERAVLDGDTEWLHQNCTGDASRLFRSTKRVDARFHKTNRKRTTYYE